MTNPNPSRRPTHTMDARHPRALFPALVPTDSRPTIGVLALQGDVREHSLALEAAGARPVVVRRATDLGQSPGDRIDGLVIPGGESTTMSTLLTSFDMLVPLRELIMAGMPAYGSCAGMIMLADRVEGAQEDQEFLGGIDMTVRRNAFGRQVDSYEEDLAAPALARGGTGRCAPSSSGPPGWRRWAPASRFSPRPAQDVRLGSAGPTAVGSSRFVRAPCSPRPSTRRSEATTGSTTSSSPW